MTQISLSHKEPARTWEGLNVAFASSLGISQANDGKKLEACSRDLVGAANFHQKKHQNISTQVTFELLNPNYMFQMRKCFKVGILTSVQLLSDAYHYHNHC